MYFEIDNTPEHIRRARRAEVTRKESPKEECPRLVLGPFTRPPQVEFNDVLIGSTCERNLEVFNPSKQAQQITLGRTLPPGLVVQLPGEWMFLEPETCYILTLLWTPTQPTSLRETIRFTNENRGRYDVIVILKSTMNIKGKSNNPKGFKISPGKMKKKPTKKSPVAIYKKKAEIIYNTTKVKKSIDIVQTTQYTQHKVLKTSNKENIPNDYLQSQTYKCPFDSPTSLDLNFNTSEIFSNMRRAPSERVLQQTYDKSEILSNNRQDNILRESKDNILKPSNQNNQNVSITDMLDNLTFTPLKGLPSKNEKLDKGPKIILSMNSDSDFDDSLNMKNSNKENETHSIICITSSQPPNKWLTVNHHSHFDQSNQCVETPTLPSKKIPNTSSPKEFNSPNFTINTEFSRISDLSFFPQRFSTERKILPKVNNETHEIIDITNSKLSSDTYTKESPNTPRDFYGHHAGQELKPENPKMCRQSLFKEYQRHNEINLNNYLPRPELHHYWNNEYKGEARSPPRSITPPLQSIPEESGQFSDTQVFDKSHRHTNTFTLNQTFDKSAAKNSISHSTRQSWSKKAVKAEPELWKMPVPLAKSAKSKSTMRSKESLSVKDCPTATINKSINQNISLNQVGNVYSQSFTVDPFLSATYFYDERAVENFEKEFKRWLNCILTPPADLDSNIEQKVDVGKAWIENRNKEVPAAPTKEQVCSNYHNSHRLESLRRSARALLLSSEIAQVFLKLNTHIEKKLIVIRTDRNLHLDIGLQKAIMELLLSYNPLWLRIGLEAIYGLVLPLKSNSDIEGLTTFIIQRMFKNPHLKNKHSKSSAPNMLRPAYMEAIKKFTLKKFFMLVFFLDQAKQKKLISHDPCLFCRNAVCKESREIVIRFTRELIAGIGDITKHLRPIGYVVSHKQSYLDEYKYAVHNIAVDIRDGVRLTKVMEIILMKDGLLTQLRTPAISRLQKVHNVQVALNALKEAKFVIVGDISAADIADGHREKTLSLLWQLIHVFRAPLFEKAANVIQIWWRKKFEVIMEKRREQERIFKMHNNAASVIQDWWRRIQYNRMVETRMRQVTVATITIQKYFRMWYYRSRLLKLKSSVLYIEDWYKHMKLIKEAQETLNMLRSRREELRRKSAVVIQASVRRWICATQYRQKLRKIVLVQTMIRGFLTRRRYLKSLKSILYVQQKYKGKLLMKQQMRNFIEMRKSAILIQSYYRMWKQRSSFLKLKKSVRIIEDRYAALIQMRRARNAYFKLKAVTTKVQAMVKCKIVRNNYLRQRSAIIKLQRRVKAHQAMLKERSKYIQTTNAVSTLQKYIRSYLMTKNIRSHYIYVRTCTITIQRYYRSYLLAKSKRNEYLKLKNATVVLQKHYRSLLLMRRERTAYMQLRNATIVIQRHFRAQLLMSSSREMYQRLIKATITIQNKYRALIKMRHQRSKYLKQKGACVIIQNAYRAIKTGKQMRNRYLKQKKAAIKIQTWFRAHKKGTIQKQQYEQLKQASTTIQKRFRAYVVGRQQRQEYVRIKTATICIQKYYRYYIETKIVRQRFIQLKKSTTLIQRFYRSYLETKRIRNTFLQMKTATVFIQHYYRYYKESKLIRHKYLELRKATVTIQSRYRALCAMRREKQRYLTLRHSVLTVQRKYRALIKMRVERKEYLKLRCAAVAIQRRWRANRLMKQDRSKYLKLQYACVFIQEFYRAYKKGTEQRKQYLRLKQASITLQRKYRALITMRNNKNAYTTLRSAAITLQRRFRARCSMMEERSKFLRLLKSVTTIQRFYRAHIMRKMEREKYLRLKTACISIQTRYRECRETQKLRSQYLHIRNIVIAIQRRVRANNVARENQRIEAANKIKTWYASVKKTKECRLSFLTLKKSVIRIQTVFRMYIIRKRFLALKTAATTIQRYYRFYLLAKSHRREYVNMKTSVIKLQSHVRCFIERKRYLKIRTAVLVIQAAFRLKKSNDILKKKRIEAAICLQKYVRRYLIQSRYSQYRSKVIYIQKLWRGILVTRLMRCSFLQKKTMTIKLQAYIRGYLIRQEVKCKRENLLKIREEQRRNWAASKIQALFRGHKAREASDPRVQVLRRRWRAGALRSTQESLRERNEEAMEVLCNMSDIQTVIRAFQSLELLTEIFPMMYNANASSIVRRVYVYMSVTNRSISSIEVLKSAASVLVNLTRYKVTGPKIYARERITPTLKFMWRFSNSETHLFCILATYLWLFSKYTNVKQDLTEFLHIPENHKMMVTIKGNINRMKRMTGNFRNKCNTPQPSKFVSHTMNQSLNHSVCSNGSNYDVLLPALEPDYGIVRVDKPRYFEDAQQAITCLFNVYKL
ncbi:uncharacterized protein asp [Epargyreus clarus]|uniref:uncharacterized protein asp n=1 Tax=Epargyreus clarus TaxID=520877 RepID=UPI003C2C571B